MLMNQLKRQPYYCQAQEAQAPTGGEVAADLHVERGFRCLTSVPSWKWQDLLCQLQLSSC